MSGQNRKLLDKIPNDTILLVIMCIFVIILILLWTTPKVKLLKGFWLADADYCEQAGLQYYLLRIGEMSGINTYNAYILAANEKGIIMNNHLKLDFGINLSQLASQKIEGCVEIDVLDDEYEEFFLPKKMDYTYYPYHGKLIWECEDHIMGIFYKNASMSSVELHKEQSDSESSDEE